MVAWRMGAATLYFGPPSDTAEGVANNRLFALDAAALGAVAPLPPPVANAWWYDVASGAMIDAAANDGRGADDGADGGGAVCGMAALIMIG